MKLAILTIILFFQVSFLTAQFGEQQVISAEVNGIKRTIPYDVDSDGYMDIISAIFAGGKIVWHKNQNGLGDFSEEILITNQALAIEGMELFDINGDNKMDIIYKTNLDKIAWLENIDGQGNFSDEQIIADTYYPYSMNASDIDGDGDLDIFSIVHYSTTNYSIIWYENLDGQGNFSTGNNIVITNDYIKDIQLFDLDSDGDQDIVFAINNGPARLVWYENLNGLGNFDALKEIYQFQFSSGWTTINNITPFDINNDGKIDIVIDTSLDDEFIQQESIDWLENIDNQGEFSTPNFIDNRFTANDSLRVYDLDNDGDGDILVAFYDNENSLISWFENIDGLGDFGNEQIISSEVNRAIDAEAADFNGDGFLDIVSASSGDDKVAWYAYEELGVVEINTNKLTLYPNPTTDFVQIKTSQLITQVDIYNVLGEKVKTILNQKHINVSDFVSGVYLLQIKGENGFSEIHKLIKK